MNDFTPDLAGTSLPPQNIEAEEIILGGILFDPNAMGKVIDILQPEAFYVQAHRQIYEAARQLYFQGQPVDLMTVATWLNDQGLLEKVGGNTKIFSLLDRTVSASNIERYVPLITEKYIRRLLISTAKEISELGFDTSQNLDNVLDEAEQKIFSLTQARITEGLIPISSTLIDTFTEIQAFQEKTALPGISTEFYDLDGMTGGFQRSDLIIIAARPSMGKCLTSDSTIVLNDGSISTIKEFYDHRQGKVLTLKDNWKFILTQPSDFIDDGVKPVFGVTTKLGRYVETTITHPYLTVKGWQQLSQLKEGDNIAVPRCINIFGDTIIPDYQVKLLAYCMGGTSLDHIYTQFINNYSPLLQKDFIESVNNFRGIKTSIHNCRQDDVAEVWNWFNNLETSEVNGQKNIPSLVFKLSKSLLSLFINRLFAIDGWLTLSDGVELGYSTIRKTFARQLQHLLLRFGIIADLKLTQYPSTENQRWNLTIIETNSIKTFIDDIGIWGREDILIKVKAVLINQCKQDYPINPDLTGSDIYWDEIVSIEYIGKKQVYDLTIPATHNFVANDICVHNTSFALNIASNVAKHSNLAVAIFSLEMSREQLAMRLLSSEGRIESNRLKSGRITEQEMEPLMMAMGTLSELPIYIDDTANLTVMQMRSEVRRLQAEKKGKLGLVLLDYLQLMQGGGDNRVQELSKMTRALKGLAREINAPVIALSQLSRAVEQRTNKRPMLSDLRESGCLSGDSMVLMADSGEKVPIRDLEGKSGFAVWGLDEATMTMERALVSNAFSTGVKPVWRLTTELGHRIKATVNHKFLTCDGWQRLDMLGSGDRISIPQLTVEKGNIYWDKIERIEFIGEEKVYDLTVPKLHNFVAENIYVHNSIEQDADLVLMLYRDEYYHPDSVDQGVAEVIVAKHRNGPTGQIKLLFRPELTQFLNMKRGG